MIIAVTRDKKQYHINQSFAGAVSEFADVLDDERLGVPYMVYVIYTTDVAEDNLYASLPKKIRETVVADDLKLDAALLKDAKVKAALKKYSLFCNENVGYKFKEAYNTGMNKLAEYVNSTGKLVDESAKAFSSVMKEMPAILKGRQDIEKVGTQLEIKRGQVRGKRELTLAEKAQ